MIITSCPSWELEMVQPAFKFSKLYLGLIFGLCNNNADWKNVLPAQEIHPLAFLPRWLVGRFLALRATVELWAILGLVSLCWDASPSIGALGLQLTSSHYSPVMLWGFSPTSFGEVISEQGRFMRERAWSFYWGPRFEVHDRLTLSP